MQPGGLVFPARAGMIRWLGSTALAAGRIPRESGDDPDAERVISAQAVYSPRERG